jgi:hypothetical protein
MPILIIYGGRYSVRWHIQYLEVVLGCCQLRILRVGAGFIPQTTENAVPV